MKQFKVLFPLLALFVIAIYSILQAISNSLFPMDLQQIVGLFLLIINLVVYFFARKYNKFMRFYVTLQVK
jgi:positive regulator of sigma E activity